MRGLSVLGFTAFFVAEWIHCTLFWIILPTIKLKVYSFGGLWTQQLSNLGVQSFGCWGGFRRSVSSLHPLSEAVAWN